MGNRIESIFADRKANDAKALMPFVVGGRPAPGDLAPMLSAMHSAGASIVEIGIPFSDPIADGPIIASSMHEALEAGATPEAVFDAVIEARANPALGALGLVAMVSMSIVYRYGPARFCELCAQAGFDGIIVPDVPLEEAEQITPHAKTAGLTCTFLVAPTTPIERAKQIAERCTGFVYVLARAGITGEQGGGPSDALPARISALRKATDLPIAVGFGINTGQDVRSVVHDAGADAAIVGSALVKRLESASANKNAASIAGEFAAELATGL